MKYRTLIIIALLLSACRTPQQIFKSESIIKSSDTLYIERTPPLHDTLYIPLPAVHTGSAPCDSLCQQQLTDALSRLATAKHSSGNSYGIYYDKYRQQLVLYQQLQEQLNSRQRSTVSTQQTVVQTQKIPVPYTPLYTKILAWIGVAAVGYLIFRISKLIK
ncbi:hypothetical protein [Capnocytophaga bilenii]